MKDNFYRQSPASVPNLKDGSRRRVHEVPTEFLWSSVESMVLQLQKVFDHEEDILRSFNVTLLSNIYKAY